MGPLGCPEPEGGVWAGRAGRACAGGTLRGRAGARGTCPGASRLVRTGPSGAVGRALAPPGRGRPSPARSTARAPASRRPAGGPGRRRCCPGAATLGGAARERGMPDPEACAAGGGRPRHGGRYAREARGLPGAPRGVPPGRPGHHPGWFPWDERTRGPGADRADTLSGQAATGSYDNTRLALARGPQPLWSYWEDKLTVSTVV